MIGELSERAALAAMNDGDGFARPIATTIAACCSIGAMNRPCVQPWFA
jgi:hypothetical protein